MSKHGGSGMIVVVETKASRRRRLSAMLRQLPEVEESGDQHSKFTVRGRTVAYYLDDHHGDGVVAVDCKAPPGMQAELVSRDPDRYHVPAYLGAKGWVGLRLDLEEVDWDEVEELVIDSYRLVAPKRLAATLDLPER